MSKVRRPSMFSTVVGRALTMRSLGDGDLGGLVRAATVRSMEARPTTSAGEQEVGQVVARATPELRVEDVPLKKFKVTRRKRECEVEVARQASTSARSAKGRSARDAGWRGAGAA